MLRFDYNFKVFGDKFWSLEEIIWFFRGKCNGCSFMELFVNVYMIKFEK